MICSPSDYFFNGNVFFFELQRWYFFQTFIALVVIQGPKSAFIGLAFSYDHQAKHCWVLFFSVMLVYKLVCSGKFLREGAFALIIIVNSCVKPGTCTCLAVSLMICFPIRT